MPNDNPSKGVNKQAQEQGLEVKKVNPPLPPDRPPSTHTKTVSDQHVQENDLGLEDRIKRAERLMLFLTAAIALFALGSVIVGFLQWNAMQGQLGEMKSGGVDTHSLSVAAGKQADNLSESLRKTDDLIRQATEQAKATNELARQAQKSADAAKRQLQMSERPWVYATNWSLIEPLSFTEKGGVVRIAITLKNVGRSPAIHVRFISKIMGWGKDFLRQQTEFCDSWKIVHKGQLPGNTIFAGEQLPANYVTDINSDELRIALQKSELPGKISPWLVACIDYEFSFDSGHHQTRYAFPLGRPMASGGWMGFFVPSGTPEGVVLIPSMMGEWAN
jgi:hypothetical protein